MPWAPELFSAPVLARLEEQRQHKLVDVPLWDGLMTGELDALMGHSPASPKYTTLYAVASGARRSSGRSSPS